MRKTLLIALTAFLCPYAFGESYPRHSAGGRIAGGFYGHSEGQGLTRVIAGAEACLYCDGRRGLFLEYSHFFPPGSGDDNGANLVGAGIRLQTAQKTRFFFDVGIAASNSATSGSTFGAALGIGLQVNAGPHLYFSPFFRTYPMTRVHIAGSFGTGVGWRF